MMSGGLGKAIAGSGNIRQAGRRLTATAQAEDPKQPATSAYEGISGGEAISQVVILTALKEEHQAVEAHLEPFGQATRLWEEVHSSGTIYTQGQFKTPTCAWNVAIAQIDMGNVSAAMEAVRAIEHFKPRVVLFVGVAGGIKGVEIGDVVAAPIVYSYECGKNLGDRTLPRPKLGEADYNLKQRARAEARKEDWRSRIRPAQTPSAKTPEVYIKPIAAGEKVIASRQSAIYNYLREYYDDAVAVEMEGFGFLKATGQVKTVSAMAIRGISDLIDGKNDDSVEPERIRQEKAARHASAFAFELLAKLDGVAVSDRVGEQTDSIEIDPDETLPEHLASLSVEAIEGDEYYLRAHRGRQTLEERGKFAPLLARLPERIESDKNSINSENAENHFVNLVGDVDNCNEELQTHPTCPIGRFLQWFPKQIGSEPSEETYLAIDDRTDLGIPWELLEVNEVPLGAAVQTIHQCPELQKSDAVERCCRGGVLAYATARTHRWQTSYRYQSYSEFGEFLGNLQRPQTDYGLVFIDGFGIRESLQLNPRGYIKRSALFKSRSSVVFVNGRLTFDQPVSLSHSTFLTLFLKHGARGAIGTLKPIEAGISQQVVETFFRLFRERGQNRPPTIPALLNQMRRQANERLKNEVLDEENCALYLATFLYVYYGNPLTILQLTPANL